MKYLDKGYLESFDKDIFQSASPFPYAVFKNILKAEAYQTLIENLPDLQQFEKSVGKGRAYGQKSHDRFILEYSDNKIVPDCWHEFISELSSRPYKKFLSRLYGTPFFRVRFHWHYSFSGCSVSPHCDGRTKLGSQIFYLNTEKDWRDEWGGDTLILSPQKFIPPESNPEFSEFNVASTSGPRGNVSLLFKRTDNGWHGVHELRCPEGALRKVFILVIDMEKPSQKIKQIIKSGISQLKSMRG